MTSADTLIFAVVASMSIASLNLSLLINSVGFYQVCVLRGRGSSPSAPSLDTCRGPQCNATQRRTPRSSNCKLGLTGVGRGGYREGRMHSSLLSTRHGLANVCARPQSAPHTVQHTTPAARHTQGNVLVSPWREPFSPPATAAAHAAPAWPIMMTRGSLFHARADERPCPCLSPSPCTAPLPTPAASRPDTSPGPSLPSMLRPARSPSCSSSPLCAWWSSSGSGAALRRPPC